MCDIAFLVVKQNPADQKMANKDRNLKWCDEAKNIHYKLIQNKKTKNEK